MDLQNQASNMNQLAYIQSSREMEEIKGMIFVAKTFPRDEQASLVAILRACNDPEIANEGIYSYPRGRGEDGKPNMVEGPSIRLAEIMKQLYGNFTSGIIEVERNEKLKVATMKAFAWDIQNNTRTEKIFLVPLIRVTRKNTYDLTDPRDIYEATANQGARRERSCILAQIPFDIKKAAISACKATMEKNTDLKDWTAKVIKAFEFFKVSVAMLEKYIGKKSTAWNRDELTGLKAVHTALKDNVAKPGDYFEEFRDVSASLKGNPTGLDQEMGSDA